jgi:hypothetical protein
MAREEARLVDVEREKDRCRQAQAENPGQDFGCDAIHVPRAEDFLQDRIFRFAPSMPDRLIAVAVVLGLVGFLVGASFVGAEWSAGTMAQLLLWEPRRLRVLLAKSLALVLVLAGLGIVVSAVALGGHYIVAETRGELTGTTSGVWQSLGLRALRGSVLGAFAGLLGMSIAGAVRNTSAALGVAFAYFLGGELAIRAVWPKSEAWLLSSNVGAWTQYGVRIPRFECPPLGGECRETIINVSFGDAAAFLGCVLAALLAAFAVTLLRRDVA